jgi:hypothetical protein
LQTLTGGSACATLEAIDTTCADGVGLKWFNWLYLQVTQSVEARIAAGGFAEGAWLAELDVQFARIYFAALESALSGEAAAECRQILFASRSQAAVARIQFALAETLDGFTTVIGKALLAPEP